MKIYLLRHGETTASKTGGYCGSSDPGLTKTGCEMAKEFAQAHAETQWTAILSSPLKRSIETATPLSEKMGLPIEQHEGLKEIDFGEWEGKVPEDVDHEFHDDYIRWQADPGWNAPTGGEKGVTVAWNSSLVIKEIEKKYPDGNVLVVSHKATIRIIICALLGIDIGRYRDRINMPVGSVSIVEITEQGPLLHLLGDQSHLKKSIRSQ